MLRQEYAHLMGVVWCIGPFHLVEAGTYFERIFHKDKFVFVNSWLIVYFFIFFFYDLIVWFIYENLEGNYQYFFLQYNNVKNKYKK